MNAIDIEELCEILELKAARSEPELRLSDIDGWDSMAALTLMAYLASEHSISVNTSEVAALVTWGDLMDFLTELGLNCER